MKPYKGELYNWRKVSCDQRGYASPPFGATGYFYILGFTSKQIRKPGTIRATSRVVDWYINENGGFVETLNSVYRLVGEESCATSYQYQSSLE